MTATECKSDFKLTTDTPYHALMGELWGVYYENFEENWLCYNNTTLYVTMQFMGHNNELWLNYLCWCLTLIDWHMYASVN